MKKIFCSLCLGLMVSVYSCNMLLSPEIYEEEIEDAVKYHIALADYLIELAQNPLFAFGALLNSDAIDEAIDQMTTEFDEIYVSKDMTYQNVLKKVAKNSNSEYQKDAKEILKNYNRITVSLSDFVESSSCKDYKSWKFKEQHSGIEFLLEFSDADTENMTRMCSPIEKSYEKYISNGVN